MGGEYNKFGVSLDALADAEKGVDTAVSELADMGGWPMGHLAAQHGANLDDATDLSTTTVGHEPLSLALETFGESWEWGIKYLVDEGRQAAEALGDVRTTYQKVDDFAKSTLHFLIGDPMQDHSAWADKSWGEINASMAPGLAVEHLEQQSGRDLDGNDTIGTTGKTP